MNEVLAQSLEIMYEGYPLTFIITVLFYILVKIMGRFKVKQEK